MPGTVVAEHGRDWDQFLQPLIFAYNTSFMTAAGDTPFFLLYGRDPVLPIDIATGAVTAAGVEVDSYRNLSAYGQALVLRMQSAFEAARAANLAAQEHDRDIFARRHRGRLINFETNDLVYVFSPRKNQGPSRKLLKQWSGPYRVMTKVQPYLYSVVAADGRGGAEIKVHAERLKPYTRRHAHMAAEPAADIAQLEDGDKLAEPGAKVPHLARAPDAPEQRQPTREEQALVGKLFQSPRDRQAYQVVGVLWHAQHANVVALAMQVKRKRGAWTIINKTKPVFCFTISEVQEWSLLTSSRELFSEGGEVGRRRHRRWRSRSRSSQRRPRRSRRGQTRHLQSHRGAALAPTGVRVSKG